MKICLIRPPTILPIGSVKAHQGVPPLALAYLAGTLKQAGHSVKCIDAFGEKINSFSKSKYQQIMINGLTASEIVERIPTDTELIGVSCMFSNEWVYCEVVIKEIRKYFPRAYIVLGGEHVTADYEYILKNYSEVDVCILGEGEEKILNLVQALENKNALEQILGIAFYSKEYKSVISTSKLQRIKNIDSIPWPDWSGIPLNNYLNLGLGMAAQKQRSMPLLASRGCPYRCTFCSSEKMWTTQWNSRDVDDVIKEIKWAIHHYQVAHIEFYDLTAIINRNWIISFCQKLIEQKIHITWGLPSGTRSEALSKDVLELLAKSGCKKLTYAPETGSSRMLNLIKKKVNLSKMLSSMKAAQKNNIIVKANMIFGFPDQKLSDVIFDYLLLWKMAWVGVHDVTCFAFVPYPGSELFMRLEKEGKIIRDENYHEFLAYNVYNSPFNMRSWSKSIPHFLIPCLTLGGMAFFYSLQFIFRPKRLFHFLINMITRRPITMLELAFDGMIEDFIKRRRLPS